ncbi:MAG: hypothetical protein JWN01_847 [Patescibacteria group bacterium]|nr:hypothetical protein [Patescibacteria group bacterium]
MRKRSLNVIMAVILAALTMIPIAAHADTSDAYTQIVNHQVPIQPDGASTYMFGDPNFGRYYAGPNGLEVRFGSNGTAIVLTTVLGLESAGVGSTISGSISTVGGVLLASIPSAGVRSAFAAIDTGAAQASAHPRRLHGNLGL